MNIWIPKIGWAAALFNLLASGPERWWCRFAIEDVALCDLRCGTLWARRWHFPMFNYYYDYGRKCKPEAPVCAPC